jgi:hypothetical protein
MKIDVRHLVKQLQRERDTIDAALAALAALNSTQPNFRPTGRRGKRKMSAAARKRISRAQKARWKAQKAKTKA